MSSQEITTIIAAVALGLVQIIVAWRTGQKVDDAQRLTARRDAKSDDKLDAIHTLTNSNLHTVTADLAIANERIAKLESMLVTSPPEVAAPKKAKATIAKDAK